MSILKPTGLLALFSTLIATADGRMSQTKDSFIDLERRRRQLESNVSELQKLLQHWQTWEAEYEGLKEEIESLGVDASLPTIQVIVDDFNGELLTRSEISKLIKDDKGATRKAPQIRSLLDRRIDYVQENVKSLQKRRDAAESRLAGISVVMQPEARDEEGLPLTEITEELDDDDNVISSRLQRPGDTAPQIVEALRKHGVTDLPELSVEEAASVDKDSKMATPKGGDDSGSFDETRSVQHSKSIPLKKVTFAEPENHAPNQGTTNSNSVNSFATKSLPHQDVVEEHTDDSLLPEPVIPSGETPEEAKLRREMLEYNMNNIGAIVAEIDLDEPDSDDSFSDIEDEDAYHETDEEDEDQWGRTTLRAVSDDYRREMLELERKLNAKSMINAGPNFYDGSSNADKLQQHKTNRMDETENSRDAVSLQKKKVKFANRLDIQTTPIEEMASQPSSEDIASSPLVQTVVEQVGPEKGAPIIPGKAKDNSSLKPSTIDSDRAAALENPGSILSNGPLAGMRSDRLKPISRLQRNTGFESQSSQPTSRGAGGHIISRNLVEQPPSSNFQLEEPDDLDPQLMRQQAAVQYHEMRNRMIQRNGGFTEQDDNGPDPDRPKVSRFKAARMTKVVK